jgi:outer membrane receptor protein involved in Fe transport
MKTTKTFLKKPLVAAIGTALAGTSPAVLAQNSAAEDLLDEITVTATRRDASIHDIPFNISAVSGDEIEAANLVDSSELLRALPGVTASDGGERLAENNNSISIRGLNIDPNATDRAFLSDPSVSTYIGDTPIFANFILRDMERVEVLRGPQGTLYGSGSLGGTVRFMPKRPDASGFSSTVRASFGETDGSSGNNMSVDAMLNVPLSDTAAIRITAGKIDNDGVVDYANVYQYDANRHPVAAGGDIANGDPVYESVPDMDTVEVTHGRLSLLLEPSDDFSALVTYMTQEGDFGGRRQVTSGQNGWDEFYTEYEIGAVVPEPASSESDLVSLEIQYDLGFATLSSSTSSYERTYDGVSDNTGFFAARGWIYWYGYGQWPRPALAADRQFTEEAFVQEFRLASNGDGAVDWIVGAYYMDQEGSAAQQTRALGFHEWRAAAEDPDNPDFDLAGNYIGGTWYDPSTDVTFDWTYDKDFTDLAFFGEVTWSVSDTVDVTLGARHFDNEHTVTSQTSFPIWYWPNPVINETNKDDDILFKGNISWDMSDTHMVYGTISEGYRRGGTNAAPVRPDPSYPNDPEWNSFESDTALNFEVGIKGRMEDLSYTASLFHVDWDKPQLNVATPSGAYYAVANGEEAQSIGLETEFFWQASDNFRLSGGYTYIEAELTEDLLLHDASDTTDGKSELRATDGASVPMTPEHSINLSGVFSSELSSGRMLITRMDGYYQSDVENSILNIDPNWNETLGGFTLWNASVTLDSESWSVGLYVSNLFNEEGKTALYKEEYMTSDPGMNFYGTGQKDFIARPRTFTIGGTFRF